jgi:hypothetical protein
VPLVLVRGQAEADLGGELLVCPTTTKALVIMAVGIWVAMVKVSVSAGTIHLRIAGMTSVGSRFSP